MRMDIYNASFTSQYDVMPSIEVEARVEAETRDDCIELTKMLNCRSMLSMADVFGKILCSCVYPENSLPSIKNVYFNNPVTVVLWDDGTKTVVRCQKGDTYSRETGLALCMAKKAMGNKSAFNDIFHKWIPEEKKPKKAPLKTKTENKTSCLTCKHNHCEWTEAPCNICESGNRWEAKAKRKKQSR